MNIERLKYTVWFVKTEEILECNNLQVLYKAARREYKKCERTGQKFVAKFYRNLPNYSFSSHIPFYIMGYKI